MQIALKTKRQNISELFQDSPYIEDTLNINEISEIAKNKKVKGVIFDREEHTSHDILEFREQFPDINAIVLQDQEDELFKKSCLAHNIQVLLSDVEDEILLGVINEEWFGASHQGPEVNIIAVRGTHRQAGTTQTSLSMARSIAAYDHKAAVVGLNPYNPGSLPNLDEKYSLDQVYDLLESGVIKDSESLMKYFIDVDGFYYLVGNKDLYRALSFKREPIDYMISLLKENFDTIIFDVGSFFDSYLAMTGLQQAQTHILVGTQEWCSISDYKRWQEQYLTAFDLEPDHSYLIVNKYSAHAIISPKQLEESVDIGVLSYIPFFPESADAEYDDGILFDTNYKPYNKAINGIVKALIEDIDESKRKKNGSWLSSLKERMFS